MDRETKLSLIMKSLTEFYNKDPKYITKIISIVNQNNIISLRILDWFITNYSKKIKTVIPGNINKMDVYMHYKLMLKGYNKSSFDPFSRRNKICFYYKEDCECGDSCTHFIETSCGQLSFFKWCFENNILEYVDKHLAIIEADMKNSLKQKNQPEEIDSKVDGQTRIKKRKPLSISAARSINKTHLKYVMKFD